MGCAASCIAPSVADLRRSVKSGDVETALCMLTSCPHLLSSPISLFSSTAVTPLHAACEWKQIRVVEKILSFLASCELPTVHEALRPYCLRALAPLPSSVADGVRMAVKMTDSKGQTPLMYACACGSPELVQLLLMKGADPWARDLRAGRTALHYAVMTHSAAGMKALMKYIPRDMLTWDSCRYVDTCSDCGLTAMHYCVFSNNLEALRELLYVHHLDVNAATKNQSYDDLWVLEAASTPLHFAAARGSLAAAVELLRYYDQRVVEDPLIEDPRTRVDALGQTPYQLVMLIHPSHRELSALLQPNQPLRAALRTALMTCGAELIRGPPPLVALAAEVLRHKLLKDVRCSVAAVAASAPSKPEAAVSPDPLEGPRFLRVSSLVSPALACSSSSTDRPDSSTDGGGADANKSPKMLSGVACVSGTHPGHNRTVPRLPHSTTDANAGISVSERCTGAAGPMKLSPVGGCGTSQGEEGVVRCVGSGTGGSAGSGFYRASSPGFRVVRDSAWDDGEEDHEGEGVQCGVCLEVPMTVMPASCGHGICGGCAEQLCAGLQNKPLPCPFCRRLVSAFVPWQRARFKTQSFWGP